MNEITRYEVNKLLSELWVENPKIEDIINKTLRLFDRTLSDDDKNEIVLNWLERLKILKRYNGISPMFYRDTVSIHQSRIHSLVNQLQFVLLYIYWYDFDHSYAHTLWYIHDDIEWVSPLWDITTDKKNELSQESIIIMKKIEERCANLLCKYIELPEFYWDDGNKAKLYNDSVHKNTAISKIVSLIDKIDWFMSALHELIAWNEDFRKPVIDYINYFKSLMKNNTLNELTWINIQKYLNFLWNHHVWWSIPDWWINYETAKTLNWENEHEVFKNFMYASSYFDLESYILLERKIADLIWLNVNHTEDSVKNEDYWIPWYMAWKKATFCMWYSEMDWKRYSAIELLTIKREWVY